MLYVQAFQFRETWTQLTRDFDKFWEYIIYEAYSDGC